MKRKMIRIINLIKKLGYGNLNNYSSSDIATGPYNAKDIR